MMTRIKLKTKYSKIVLTLFFSSILLLLFIALGILPFMYGFWSSSQKFDWTQELVNEKIGVAIPVDVSNIEFSGSRSWSDHLRLSFQGTPEVIDRFARHYCNGEYFSGFNPFEAQDTSEPLDGSHLIKLYSYSYYAFSVGTPLSMWGNRCEALPADAGYIEILIDKSNPRQYQIRMELYFHCNACRNILPSNSFVNQ